MQYRFTQMAANVMHYSKEAAAELNHSYIGTEHILIGLLREKEGLACQVLEDHDVTEEKVLHMVSQLIQGSQTIVAEPEEYTPRSHAVQSFSNRNGTSFDCHIKRNRLCCGTAVIFPWCAGTKGLSGYCTWYRYGCQGSEGRYAVGQGQVAEEERTFNG